MAVLELLTGERAGQRFPLGSEPTILGRHPDCTVVLDQGAVSRQHAAISVVNGEYFVEDLHSRNGTSVNNAPIHEVRKLVNGDRLKICDIEFSFYHDERRRPVDNRGTDAFFEGRFWDETEGKQQAQIMSKLDVSASSSGVRLAVNPEVKLRALIEITQNLSKAMSLDIV